MRICFESPEELYHFNFLILSHTFWISLRLPESYSTECHSTPLSTASISSLIRQVFQRHSTRARSCPLVACCLNFKRFARTSWSYLGDLISPTLSNSLGKFVRSPIELYLFHMSFKFRVFRSLIDRLLSCIHLILTICFIWCFTSFA